MNPTCHTNKNISSPCFPNFCNESDHFFPTTTPSYSVYLAFFKPQALRGGSSQKSLSLSSAPLLLLIPLPKISLIFFFLSSPPLGAKLLTIIKGGEKKLNRLIMGKVREGEGQDSKRKKILFHALARVCHMERHKKSAAGN